MQFGQPIPKQCGKLIAIKTHGGCPRLIRDDWGYSVPQPPAVLVNHWGIRVMPETAAKPRQKRAGATNGSRAGASASAPAKTPTEPRKTGRPSKYSPDIAQHICEQLREGVPLREICRGEGMPAWRTVYDWMGRDDALSAAIARARDIGYDAIAEECLAIADTPHMGQKQVMGEDGNVITIEDMLGHRKLQVETRLKLLAKFHPSKYGDRVAVTGVDGAPPIKTEDTSSGRLFEIIRNLEMTKRAG